jgi:putative DNA primase/helicase
MRANNMKKKTNRSDPVSRVNVLGEGEDEVGRRYMKLAVNNDASIPPLRISDISDKCSQFFATLNNHGANILTSKSRNALLKKLEERKTQSPSFKVVTKMGWSGSSYVLPDETLGASKKPIERVFDDLDHQTVSKYRVKGTLQNWQENIGDLCKENSRLMFAASLGVTGPILRFVSGPRSGGFQLVGPGEKGKTTAAMVAGSVWGCRFGGSNENAFAESWNTTRGKLELTALAHNDTLLILDETNVAEHTRSVIDAAFNLAEGREKERMTNAKSARSWRCFFLSTSNRTLEQLAEEAKVALDDARRGRLVDVPLPATGHGMYEELHGSSGGETLTDTLKSRCRSCFGAPGREFVRGLVADRKADQKAFSTLLKAERKAYHRALRDKADAEGFRPLNRASGRFATVFAAGSLAIRYKVFLWEREALLDAVLSCQLDGLRIPKTQPLAERISVQALREKLVGWLRGHQDRFMDLDKGLPKMGSHKFGSVPGYKATFKKESWFYLTSERFDEVVNKGSLAKELKSSLAKDALLDMQDNRFVVQRPIFKSTRKSNKNYRRVHALRANIISGGSD